MVREPKKDTDSPPSDWGDGGFSNPRVFDTLEEALAANTAEDDYLESLDQEDINAA